MRLASFNVNSIRRRAPHLARFLARHTPDLVFLQETKCKAEEFPHVELAASGYRIHAIGQHGGRNGVAVLGRIPFEIVAEALPGEDEDSQARYIEVRAEGAHIAGIYLPNGNSGGDEGMAYKWRWQQRLNARAAQHLDGFTPFAILGDFNVVPTARDMAPGALPPGDALVHPQSRAHFNALCHLGMTESSAALGQHQFTYWDYGAAFETNRGLRIDHAMLSPELAERLVSFSVDTEARAEDQPSDHAPVWVELRG
jgi:exodeoxyribonuclease III